jgi:hypothetical protein
MRIDQRHSETKATLRYSLACIATIQIYQFHNFNDSIESSKENEIYSLTFHFVKWWLLFILVDLATGFLLLVEQGFQWPPND